MHSQDRMSGGRTMKTLRPLHFIDAVDHEAGDMFYTYDQQVCTL